MPCLHGQLICNKGGKNRQWEKDPLFNKWCWENWTATCRKMKQDHFLTPYPKINSKWIKYLNIRPKTIKILEESTVSNLFVYRWIFKIFFFEQSTEWEKIFPNDMSDKGLVSKIYKEIIKLNIPPLKKNLFKK